ncbi:MAG: cyclic nucleotide-binding domain-containing protein [Proteobacteria bacterium]|nr:cyclic nucleotide-binding domain-containing protein [Pseudomonadota bacterium]
MDLEQARVTIENYIKEEFGKIAELREVSVTRRSTGRVWNGLLYCVTANGEIEVGSIGVTEKSELIGHFGVDELIEALRRVEPISSAVPGPVSMEPPTPEDDFGGLGLDEDDGLLGENDEDDGDFDGFFSDLDGTALKEQIVSLLNSKKEEDLIEARHSLPRLLTNPDERGPALKQMGELEIRMGEVQLGQDYLEAAAREFADRADLDTLSEVGELLVNTIGEEAFSTHPVHALLEVTRSRLLPVKKLAQVPAFAGLGDEEIFELVGAAEEATIHRGVTLLKEGTPAIQLFVVKSGVLSIHLETPQGGSRLVRCCFPGELVGESCVLGKEGETCSASVVTESKSVLWCFEGPRIKQLARDLPMIRTRIESTRALHRLDSFFSMHKATGSLDVRVRDRLIGCISGIHHAEPGEILGARGGMVPAVYLIAEGKIEYRIPEVPPREFGADSFVGLGDAIHELPLEGDFVSVESCRIFCFDTQKLQKMAQDAPPEVLAVLERIG